MTIIDIRGEGWFWTRVHQYNAGAINEWSLVTYTHKLFFGYDPDDTLRNYEIGRLKNYYVPKYGRGLGAVVWIRDFYTAYADRMGYGKIG